MTKRAFSFTELSIVLMIVSLAIAAIVKTNDLLVDMKINAAENLTKSSPARSIKGLVLWLDAATTDSFRDNERADESEITVWKDINPQANKKYYALTSSTSAITYRELSDINDLPSLYFDGSDSSAKLTLSKSESLSDATAIITPDNDFTFFVVSKLDTDAESSVVAFSNGHLGGWSYQMSGDSGSRYRRVSYPTVGNIDTTLSDGSERPEIVTVTYNGNTGQTTSMRVNGSNVAVSATSISADNPDVAMYIGNVSAGGSQWKGYISEIILFKKVLNSSQIDKIERYLSQKYKINLN
ncbi:MAG: hypothetical protein ISQ34_04270 [Rickettsiales bacterium]|nr:hypothetical protein [Rickettsiales bacterium]